MQLGKVIGNLVSTQKVKSLEGVKLMFVQPLDEQLNPAGEPAVATDATHQAGVGEIVFTVSGREAAVALPDKFNPSDLSIVGIVDQVYVGETVS